MPIRTREFPMFRPYASLLCLVVMLLAAPHVTLHAGGKKDLPKLKDPTAKEKKIAEAIGKGHSYEKHVLDEKQFPECKTQEDFIHLIAKVLANPTHHRKLENEREAY